MAEIISAAQALKFFKSGQSLMIGGFLSCGSPELIIDELIKTDLSDFTLIANDTSVPGENRGKLIEARKLKKVIVSHIGTNPLTVQYMNEGLLEVELSPQGTLAERVRAGGAGLGGFLTPVGLNTEVAKGKQVINGLLLETPLKADISITYATHCDKFGNLSFEGSTRNFNALMPMAGNISIVEVENYQETPLDPNHVVVPGVFVDYIVIRDKK